MADDVTPTPTPESPWDANGECLFCDEHVAHRADCPWLVKLETEWAAVIAENERLRADQALLVSTLRKFIIGLGNVPDDWQGSVADGVAAINANLAAVRARIHETAAALVAMFPDVDE